MRADFRLEDWVVRPLRDCIERGDEVVHVHPKPMAVLEMLAAAGGEVVTRDELFEKVWPGVIVTEDALTQCIVELRKAFGDTAHDARIIRTVPKVGFCLVTPVTILDGPTQDDQGRHHLPEGRGYRSLIIRTALVIIAVLVLVIAGRWLHGGPEETPKENETALPVSIAVLPFADLSEAGDQQVFSDGLSDEMINMLGRVEGLKVTSRTSSFYFRDTDDDLHLIADTLGVSHVLEGSVRREGEQLRVTAQLIDTGSGFNLWSGAYDRELNSVLAMQKEISEEVVQALVQNFGPQFGAVPDVADMVNLEAHDAVLMGQYLVARRTLDDIQAAIVEFEKALAIEPDYALAHAELAIALRVLRFVGGDLTLSEARTRARSHAERALDLDPNLAKAHAAAAWLQETAEEQLQHYQRAIRINPSYAIAYTWMGRLLRNESRYQESSEMFEMAIRLDPLSIPAIGNFMWYLVEKGRLDEARRETEKLALLNPGLHARARAWLDSQGGRYSVFALGLLEALSIGLDRRTNEYFLLEHLALMGLEQEAWAIRDPPPVKTLQVLGKVEDALRVAQERLTNNPDRSLTRRALGRVLAAAGNYDQARPILETSWLEAEKQVSRSGLMNEYEAVALMAIYRAAGEDMLSGELLEAMQGYVRRLKEAGITATTPQISVDFFEGITAFLSGDRETGLALIARAVDDGAFILPNEAYLKTLYDDSGFAPIMAMQQARQAREREKFLAVVCNDNPYSEVWQPAEGTCDEFLAKQGAD